MFPLLTCRFLLAKHVRVGFFPIFFRKSSSLDINSILMQLDEDLMQKKKVNVNIILKELKDINPDWPTLLDGQKLLASVMHKLYQNDDHGGVNVLMDYLFEKDFHIWGGLSTTILKSYLKQKSWRKALLWFEEAKRVGNVKHLRIYNDVINSLAANDMLKLSFHFFVEVQQQELCMTTKQIKSINQNTIKQLLLCVLRKKIILDCMMIVMLLW